MKTILVDAIFTLVLETGEINQPLLDLLETYDNPKIIVTNADSDQMVQFGLVDMPYPIFTLANDPAKTDAKYFKKLLEHFEITSDEVVYIEHNQLAVDSAKSIGIDTFLYDPDKKDMDSVKKFLDQRVGFEVI